jgi:hypothetical protein
MVIRGFYFSAKNLQASRYKPQYTLANYPPSPPKKYTEESKYMKWINIGTFLLHRDSQLNMNNNINIINT